MMLVPAWVWAVEVLEILKGLWSFRKRSPKCWDGSARVRRLLFLLLPTAWGKRVISVPYNAVTD